MEFPLKGKVAAVTGAGGGIGRAVAMKLAGEGQTRLVLLGGKNLTKLHAAEQELSRHTEVLALPGDLTDFTIFDDFASRIRERFGGLDILVNNAGTAQSTPFEQISGEELENIMKINFEAPFLLTQKMLPLLLKSPAASIVNIASVTAHSGYPLQSAYSASKHALLGFTKSLAAEYYKSGIRVHAVAPGGVYTDMIKVSRPDLSPEGMIMPEDVAEVVYFLLRTRTNAVTDEIMLHRIGKAPFLV